MVGIVRRDGSKEEVSKYTLSEYIEITKSDVVDTIVELCINYSYDHVDTLIYIIAQDDDKVFALCFKGSPIGIITYRKRFLAPISSLDKDEADRFVVMYDSTSMEELFDQLKHRGSAALEMITNACANTKPISKVKRQFN